MDRAALIPAAHRAERLFLLDAMRGAPGVFPGDAEAFLSVVPHKVRPYLHKMLERADLPDTVRSALAGAYRENALRSLRRAVDLRRICSLLDAAAIPFLVLKGPVLAATVYPDSTCRTMTDLDFLVGEGDLLRAMAALEGAGYFVPPQFEGATLEPGDAPPLIHRDGGGPSIELHALLDSFPDDRDVLARVHPSARRIDAGNGIVVPALERNEFFAHVAVHLAKHHRFEGELRSLLDVALLLRAGHLDAESGMPEWERRGIAGWIALAARLAHVLLDAPLPAPLAAYRVPDEAMAIAAAQLWIGAKSAVPVRITWALAGRSYSSLHANVPGRTAERSAGWQGARQRIARQLDRLQRVLAAAAKPRSILSEVAQHRRRERLFDLVENRDPASR